MSAQGNKENINPAVVQIEDPVHMSADEFRRTLYTWFEDRGLLSELRAHLRRQMIGILKDTNLGQSVSHVNSALSPKTQVINLLIAEFLSKHKYHYSLSVFSTEVPFINMLPEFSTTIFNTNVGESSSSKEKNFTQQSFCEILDTLGYSQGSEVSQKLYDYYFNGGEDSLILCIIKLLGTVGKVTKEQIDVEKNRIELSTEEINHFEPWLKEIHNILMHFEIPVNCLISLRSHLQSIFEREQTRIQTEEHAKYNQKQAQINRDVQNREAEINHMISEMENTFYKEKQKMSDEIIAEQNYLDKMKAHVKQQKHDYEAKNEGLEKKNEVLKQREIEIDEQLEILKTRMKVMQNVYDSIIEENSKISHLRKELQKNEQEPDETLKKLHKEYEYLRKELQETKIIIRRFGNSEGNINKEQQTTQTATTSEQLLKGMLDRLQNENSSLRILNTEQQRRLDDFSIRNSMLINDLENCQATINILTRTGARRGTITVPPLPPSPPPLPTRIPPRASTSLNGGGENLGFVPHPPTPPIYRYAYNQHFRDYTRRKTPKRLVVHSTEESSPSPTDEVLHEARQRLRRLEEETEEVDRSYRAFRQRQSQSIQENFRLLQQPMQGFSIHSLPDAVLRLRNQNTVRDVYTTSAETLLNHRPFDLHNFRFNDTSQLSSQSLNKNDGPIYTNVNIMDRTTPSTSRSILITVPNQFNFNTSNRTMNSNDNISMPGTSFEFPFVRSQEMTEMETANRDLEPLEETRPTVPSAGSSGIMSQLHNLSLSSIEVSSDVDTISEEINRPNLQKSIP